MRAFCVYFVHGLVGGWIYVYVCVSVYSWAGWWGIYVYVCVHACMYVCVHVLGPLSRSAAALLSLHALLNPTTLYPPYIFIWVYIIQTPPSAPTPQPQHNTRDTNTNTNVNNVTDAPVRVHPLEYAGKALGEKLAALRGTLKDKVWSKSVIVYGYVYIYIYVCVCTCLCVILLCVHD